MHIPSTEQIVDACITAHDEYGLRIMRGAVTRLYPEKYWSTCALGAVALAELGWPERPISVFGQPPPDRVVYGVEDDVAGVLPEIVGESPWEFIWGFDSRFPEDSRNGLYDMGVEVAARLKSLGILED